VEDTTKPHTESLVALPAQAHLPRRDAGEVPSLPGGMPQPPKLALNGMPSDPLKLMAGDLTVRDRGEFAGTSRHINLAVTSGAPGNAKLNRICQAQTNLRKLQQPGEHASAEVINAAKRELKTAVLAHNESARILREYDFLASAVKGMPDDLRRVDSLAAHAETFAALPAQERTPERYEAIATDFPKFRPLILEAHATALAAQPPQQSTLERYEAIARAVTGIDNEGSRADALSALEIAFVALPPGERTPKRYEFFCQHCGRDPERRAAWAGPIGAGRGVRRAGAAGTHAPTL
jgi:hypothetical protein